MFETEQLFILHSKNDDPTSVWSHYYKSIDNTTAKCKKCDSILKTLGGSTKGLHTHLFTKHNLKVRSADQNLPCSSKKHHNYEPSSKRRSTDYFTTEKKPALDETLARMTALDGLTFNVFITSKDLRQLLISSGFKLPTSANIIKNEVVNYSLNIRELYSKEINQCKGLGTRFSLRLNEWTSSSNKKYLNVNVHIPNKHWNLGLTRVYESMRAEECIKALTTRLNEHSLNIDTDIVAIVTEDPNVMVCAGKLVQAEHQLCLMHGIHLAVYDVLYKKCYLQDSVSKDPLEKSDTDTSFDENEDHEDVDMGLNFIHPTYNETTILFDEEDIKNLVKKVRKAVILFKRSTTNNAVLQKYVKAERGQEFSLILDCRTRWDSLLLMLKRFIDLRASICLALIELNRPITLNKNDFILISELTEVLEPIKLAVDALCRQDANLCTADAVLLFLFRQIFKKQSNFANKMFQALKLRMEKRRLVEISGVLKYLQNPTYDVENDETNVCKLFGIPSRTVIENQIKKLIERLTVLFEIKLENCSDEDVEDNMDVGRNGSSPVRAPLSLKEKLQEEIEKSMKAFEPKTQTSDLTTTIRNEMYLFENGGNRGHNLELAYQYLLSIPPASIEPERAFSASSYLGNKIRSRLDDITLDALFFLRAYFQREKEIKNK